MIIKSFKIRLLIYILIIILIININAAVDNFIHPEISYFDEEHLIVGAVNGIIGIIFGILLFYYLKQIEKNETQQKILLKELTIAKNKAEENDQLKSAFLANMSHEIRTPMNGIIGFASLLENQELSMEEQKQYVRIIIRSGKRLLDLINDIINISKIESGQMHVTFSKTNLNELLIDIFNFFNNEAEKKGILLTYSLQLPDKEAIIFTDYEKLFAALTNLIKNAIKYTEHGTIHFGYVLKNKFFEFFVKDTGIGISGSDLEKIFERFVQLKDSEVMQGEGSGLGLTITKSYVELLGGKIWVKSQQRKGSEFYFTIPCQTELTVDKTNKEEKADKVNLEKKQKLKIMVAEDDESSNMLFSKILGDQFTEILFVKTGTEAVKTVRDNPDIKVILMDVRMPEMDGLEATRIIKEMNKDIVIIGQTAYSLAGDKEKVLEAGCNDYISKPIDANKLTELILKHTEKKYTV